MTEALDRALALARERLDHDSDAYADEDLLGMLVEALDEAPGVRTIRADLEEAAALAARHAREHVDTADARNPELARRWADLARVSLEALERVPLRAVAPPEGDDEERAALARLVTEQRQRLAGADELLRRMRAEFAAAGTPVATRWAARIDAVLPPEHERQDDDRRGGTGDAEDGGRDG